MPDTDIFDDVAAERGGDIFDDVARERKTVLPKASFRSLYETPQPGPTLSERAERLGEPSPAVLGLQPKTADLTRLPLSPFTGRYLRPPMLTEEEKAKLPSLKAPPETETLTGYKVPVTLPVEPRRAARAFGAGAPAGSLMARITGQPGVRTAEEMRLFAPEQLMTEAERARHPILTGAGEFAGGFTSPEGLALLVGTAGAGQLAGPAAQTVKQLLAAGFTAQMLTDAAQRVPEISEAIKRGDYYTAQRLATHAVLGATTAGLAGRGMLPERAPLYARPGEVGAPLAMDTATARGARRIEDFAANVAAREGMARLAKRERGIEEARLGRINAPVEIPRTYEGAPPILAGQRFGPERNPLEVEAERVRDERAARGEEIPILDRRRVTLEPETAREEPPYYVLGKSEPLLGRGLIEKPSAGELLGARGRPARLDKLAEQVLGRGDIFDSVAQERAAEAPAPAEALPKFRSAARANLALRGERGMTAEDRLATLKENRDYLLSQRERVAEASPEERAARERELSAVQQDIAAIEGKPPLEKFSERPPREPRIPLEQRFPPDVLEEARQEMRAAADMATSMERPGRYFAGVGQTEQGFIKESPKEGIRHGGSWYGVTSMRDFVAGQFPWYGKITEGPETLARLVERGKGAAHDRILERIAEGIQQERESARPVVEEYAPQLRVLAGQMRNVDPGLAETLEDLASGKAVGFRNLREYIEGKIHDAQAAANFSRAVNEAGTEAGEPARFEEPARLGSEARPAEARGGEEATGEPIRAVEPATLPGLESAVREQREAAGRETARQLSEEISRPSESVEAAAGEMERTSPLFRGTEASPQREMFRPGGDIFDEVAKETPKPKGTTFYSNAVLDPAAWREAFPSVTKVLARFGKTELTPGDIERGILREQTGGLARRKEQLYKALEAKAEEWDGRTAEEQLDFILREQHGQKQANSADQALADRLREMFAERRQQIESLGHGAFNRWREHYFPQMWERPNQVRDWVQDVLAGKRKLEGPGSFKKQRVFDDIQAGIDAGFKPLTTNPITLALAKLHEMDRYAMAHTTLDAMKKSGLAKAVMVGQQAPAGWVRLDDRIGTVYGSPEIPVKEAFDRAVWDQLSEVATNLGIKHERAVRIGGQRLGYARPGEITTRFATPESVIAHEIGHNLDWKYGLKNQLVKNPLYAKELRALADLHIEGISPEDVPPAYRRYIRKGEEKMATMVEALLHVPEKFRQVAPNTWDFLEKFIADRPELKPLLEAKPSLRYGQRTSEVSAGGIVIHGYYYAPAEAARVFNNYLSPGLQRFRTYNAVRMVGNTLNQAQLGVSAFHLGFTSLDASVSDMALALERLSRGEVVRAVPPAVRSLTILGSPVNTFLKGNKLLREYLEPGRFAEMAKLADAVAQAGGRVHMDPYYKNQAIESFWKAWKQGSYAQAGLRAFPAAMEYLAKPVMEYVVPRQKLGVFANLAEDVFARAEREGWTREKTRYELNRAWDSVDNRMGQIVYDNLFWNRAVKDLGLVSVRSLGWNLGTAREIFGGGLDIARQTARLAAGEKAEMTHRMAYVMALPIVVGFTGAVIHYLSTGKEPEALTDYFFPQTGKIGPNGRPERLSLPSYLKDLYELNQHPGRTVLNKVHPAITATAQFLSNEDYFGTEIHHPDDPFLRQRLDDAEFIAKQFLPFSIRNAYQRAESAGETGLASPLQRRSLPGTAESFVGLVPAPRSITQTSAEQRAHEAAVRLMPQGPRTREQFERSQLLGRYRNRLRSGDMSLSDLRQEVSAGRITGRDAEAIAQSSRRSPLQADFNRLPLEDALAVWQLANAEERRNLRPLLVRKQVQLENMPRERRRELEGRLREALYGRRLPEGRPTSLLGNPPADLLGRQEQRLGLGVQ